MNDKREEAADYKLDKEKNVMKQKSLRMRKERRKRGADFKLDKKKNVMK